MHFSFIYLGFLLYFFPLDFWILTLPGGFFLCMSTVLEIGKFVLVVNAVLYCIVLLS